MKVPKEQDAQPALDKIVENGHFPSWTPDGRGLLYVHSTFRNTRIARVPSSGGTGRPEKVTDFSGADLHIEDPKISPDGAKLFYTRGRRTGDIFILRADSNAGRKSR